MKLIHYVVDPSNSERVHTAFCEDPAAWAVACISADIAVFVLSVMDMPSFEFDSTDVLDSMIPILSLRPRSSDGSNRVGFWYPVHGESDWSQGIPNARTKS